MACLLLALPFCTSLTARLYTRQRCIVLSTACRHTRALCFLSSLLCCSEGGDSDTRRRAAADLVRALTDTFEAQVTELFTGYVGALLQVRQGGQQAARQHLV